MSIHSAVGNLTEAVDKLTATTNVPASTLTTKVSNIQADQATAEATQVTAEGHVTTTDGYVTDAQGYLTTTKSGATYDASILARIQNRPETSAVDTFVYDTSNDSDGGAWRKRTQHTSWYQEEINGRWLGIRADEFQARNAYADLSPTELATNGTFDTDISGWTALNATLSHESNALRITSGSTAGNQIAYQNITGLTVGATYRLTVEVLEGTNVGQSLRVGSSAGLGNSASMIIGHPGVYEVYFTAPTTNRYISFLVYDSTGGNNFTFVIDNISVKAVSAETTQTGDYFQNSTDDKFYKLNASSGTTEVFRGGRREFPAVAVIVAESSRIIIYDADDPTMPMWMVFTNVGFLTGVTNGVPLFAVTALNGELYAGLGSGYSAGPYWGALRIVCFLEDTHRSVRIYSTHYKTSEPIAERNTLSATSTAGFDTVDTRYTGALPDSRISHVAAKVLPDAPIQPATGLPIPTVAVATDQGVGVITSDYSIRNIVNGDGTNNARRVGFSPDNLIYTQLYDDNRGIRFFEIPTANVTQPNHYTRGNAIEWYSDSHYIGGANEGDHRFLGAYSAGSAMAQKVDTYGYDIARGVDDSNVGLSRIKRTPSSPANALAAYTTHNQCTGYFPRDTKGAFLTSTETYSLVHDTDLVDNGAFASTTGWVLTGASIANGQLTLADVTSSRAEQSTAGIEPGMGVKIVVDLDATNTGSLYVQFAGQGGWTMTTAVISGTGVQTVYMTLRTDTTAGRVRLLRNAGVVTINSLSVFEAVPNAVYEYNRNRLPLEVFGTITRTPVATGAELVGYSNFRGSNGNYLVQDYSSQLDFGTGDFCMMGWFYHAAWPLNNAEPVQFYRGSSYYSATDNNIWTRFFLGAPEIVLGRSSSIEQITAPQTMSNDRWQQVVWLRRSGTIEIYIDGKLVTTGTSTRDVTNTNAKLYVGVWDNNGNPSSGDANMKLALARISATALTAEQITEIYEREKVLFQENAACSLYGTSDIVEDLAYDQHTGLLHVGTSAGRSVFDGLKRIDNTTDAVGAAISVVGNLVVEE